MTKIGNLSGILLGGFAASQLALNQLFFLCALCYGLIVMSCLFYARYTTSHNTMASWRVLSGENA